MFLSWSYQLKMTNTFINICWIVYRKKCQALTQVMCYDLHYIHMAIKDTVVTITHVTLWAFICLAQVSASVKRELRVSQKPKHTTFIWFCSLNAHGLPCSYHFYIYKLALYNIALWHLSCSGCPCARQSKVTSPGSSFNHQAKCH